MTWVAVGLLLFAVNLAVFARVLRILRERHPGTYLDLRSPTLLPRADEGFNWAIARFLYARAYRRLGDPSLTRTGDLLLGIISLYVVWILLPLFL